MIETKELREGEVVVVDLAGDESEYIESENVKCKFVNGYFQNIENNHHKGEIYGSSVVSFSPSPNATELHGTPEEIGTTIYWLLCGKNKGTKEDVENEGGSCSDGDCYGTHLSGGVLVVKRRKKTKNGNRTGKVGRC